MRAYPVFLVGLDSVRCVVIGGGRVAARKVRALLRADAQLTVVSPDRCLPLQALADEGRIEVLNRAYRPGDLREAFLVIAATDDPQTNERIWEDAQARGLLVNVVDDPQHCNFIAPSVVHRGPLKIAISTSGRCPALSRHLRRQLEEAFGPVYGDYVELLGSLRERVVEALPLAERRAFWREIFASDILSLLAIGDDGQAQLRARAILERHLAEAG